MNYEKEGYIIAVEGNVGVGKAAFLNLMKNTFDPNNTTIKKEPIHKWINIDNNKDCSTNLLDNFYSDTEKWSFATQIRCTCTRIQEYERINKPLAFCERSWYTDRHIFTETLNKLNLISDLEKTIYEDFHKWVSSKAPDIDAIIYLRASPGICFARSMNKNRHEQVSISFKYLEKLHESHELLLNSKNPNLGIPVIIIDVEEEFEDIEPRQIEIINKLVESLPFINKYKNGNFKNEKKTFPKKQSWSIVKNKNSKKKK